MITAIRKHMRSTAFKSLVWFFVIVLMLGYIGPLGEYFGGSKSWVARVNGVEIEGNDFYRAAMKQEYNIRAIREQYGPYADMFMQMLGLAQDPKVLAYHELIRETLMDQIARDIPLHMDTDYVEESFNSPDFVRRSGLHSVLPLGFFTEQGVNEQALRVYLSRMSMSNTQFTSYVAKAIARYIALELAALAAYTPSYMLQDAIARELAKKQFAVFEFPLDLFIKAVPQPSDNELAKFFKAQTKSGRYLVPEQRSGTVWSFGPDFYGIEISDDKAQEHYARHKVQEYVDTPSRVQVRRILFKVSETEPEAITSNRLRQIRSELLQNPEDFEKKALDLSEDTDSAKDGGLLPYFSKGERDRLFERKAFTLKQNGDISDVFQTEDGFELIQRVHKEPVVFKPFASVKDEIIASLTAKEFARQFSSDIRPFVNALGVDEDAFFAFVADKKASKKDISLTKKDESTLLKTLFSIKSQGQAEFFVEGGMGYVVLLDEVHKRHIPELSSIRPEVERDFIEKKAHNMRSEAVNEARTALKEKKPEDIAQQYNASLTITDFINKKSSEELEKLPGKDSYSEQMFQLEKKGSSVALPDRGYLVYVMDVEPIKQEAIDEQGASVRHRAYSQTRDRFIEGFIASLLRNATIETNNSIFTLNESQAA